MVQEYRAKGAPKPPPEETPGKGPHRHRWVFHGPPVTAPGGAVPFQVPEEFADDLARHLVSTGFFHRDELLALAGPEGMLDVATLPAPTIRHDPPEAGPETWLNPGPWVPVSTPLPDRARGRQVNLDDLTDEQVEALRVENEAIAEAIARRERWRKRLAEADPRTDADKPADGDIGGERE